MSNLFTNIIEGATAGGLLGAAADGLFVAGATIIGGPIGLATSTSIVASKEAAGALIGGGAGLIKTIVEDIIDE